MAPECANAINSPEVALELSASSCAARLVPSRHGQSPSISWTRDLHHTRASACREFDLAEFHRARTDLPSFIGWNHGSGDGAR